VVDTARQVTGLPIPAVESSRRPGDPAVLVADAAKLRKTLGWEPRHSSLQSILATAWKWKQTHPEGYPEPDARAAQKN
jgi:UDP-glucose 4-epimerase